MSTVFGSKSVYNGIGVGLSVIADFISVSCVKGLKLGDFCILVCCQLSFVFATAIDISGGVAWAWPFFP